LLGAPAAPWKGARAALEVMRACRDLPLEWHLFGVSDAFGFGDAARQALGAGTAVLREHGRYDRESIEIALRAAGIDFTRQLPPWDETYSYTLTESWLAGVPALVSARGALAERAAESGAALVARDAGEAAQRLRDLAADPSAIARLRERALAVPVPSAAETAAAHRSALGPLLARLTVRPASQPFGAGDRELFAAHWRAVVERPRDA